MMNGGNKQGNSSGSGTRRDSKAHLGPPATFDMSNRERKMTVVPGSFMSESKRTSSGGSFSKRRKSDP